MQANIAGAPQPPPPPPVPSSIVSLSFDPYDAADTLAWAGIEHIDNLLESVLFYAPPTTPRAGQQPLMSNRLTLTLLLSWFWTGLPLEKLAAGSLLGDRGLRRCFERFIDEKLIYFANAMVVLPSPLQWLLQRGNLEMEDPLALRFNIDGTPLETWSSSDPIISSENFNIKHQMPAVSFWILTGPNGRINRISGIDLGNKNDASAWKESTAVAELEVAYPPPVVLAPKLVSRAPGEAPAPVARDEYKPGINGDKAYPSIPLPKGFDLFVTKTAEPDMPQADPRRHLDPTVAKHRSVVERSFCQMKRWQLLNNVAFVSQCDRMFLGKIIHCIAALVNWRNFTELGLNSI